MAPHVDGIECVRCACCNHWLLHYYCSHLQEFQQQVAGCLPHILFVVTQALHLQVNTPSELMLGTGKRGSLKGSTRP
jgi:hypothetical protein